MISKYKLLINSFFAHRLASEVKELYSSVMILDFAISAVNIFEPVFLYLIFIEKYGISTTLKFILAFYFAVYIIYFFCIPLGAKFAKKFGYEHAIATSSIFTILFYWSLFNAAHWPWLIGVAVLMYVAQKTLYWPAYHSDFARHAANGEQGREISNLMVMLSAVYIIGPIVGGLILKFYGFGALFILVAILIVVSNIPMLITKEEFVPSPFSYKDAMRRVFSRENRRKLLAHLGFGEELIYLVIWPVFIYVVVNDFLELGFLTAISIAVTMAVYLFIGRLADKKDRRVMLRFGAIFNFFGWLFRLMARGITGVFLIDSYSRISKQIIVVPFVAQTYEQAQDSSVMNTIVFFEMALVLGKIVAIIGALILLQFFVPGWNVLFILGGVMTLFYLWF